jgi:hypothetical protein
MVDTNNKLLKIRNDPAPQGYIDSTSIFEFGAYASSKMPHHGSLASTASQPRLS